MHRSNPRVRYRAFRFREDLAEQDTVGSVGSRGDSSDNDLAKALNSRGKAELIRIGCREGALLVSRSPRQSGFTGATRTDRMACWGP